MVEARQQLLQAPPLDERFQKMREILEDGTGEDLSQYSNEDIVELYGGLADDLGVGKMTIDDAYNKMRADADLRTNINERMAQNEPADPPEAGAGTPEEQNERNLQQAIAGQERTDGVTKDTYQPIDDADVGTPETVEDEFVSSEPDPEGDIPSQEELDDMMQAEEVVEQVEPQAAGADGP